MIVCTIKKHSEIQINVYVNKYNIMIMSSLLRRKSSDISIRVWCLIRLNLFNRPLKR